MGHRGHCDKTDKDIDVEVQLFGVQEEMKCPECGETIFLMADILYHGA